MIAWSSRQLSLGVKDQVGKAAVGTAGHLTHCESLCEWTKEVRYRGAFQEGRLHCALAEQDGADIRRGLQGVKFLLGSGRGGTRRLSSAAGPPARHLNLYITSPRSSMPQLRTASDKTHPQFGWKDAMAGKAFALHI